MTRKQSTFIAVRNGQHIGQEATPEAARRVIEKSQADDRTAFEVGYTNCKPEQNVYYILPR